MPVSLASGDRKILMLGALFLLGAIGLSAFLSPRQEDISYPSSYSSAPGGAKAAYLLLKDLGYAPDRWVKPATALPAHPAGTVLVLADPFESPTESDRYAVKSFLFAGGFVLATGPRAARFLPTPPGGGHTGICNNRQLRTYPAAFPSPLTRGAPEITLSPAICWKLPISSPPGVYGAAGDAVVLSYAVGPGRVVWWAASTPLTNRGIRATGNLPLLLNSLEPAARTGILWDEYYHGDRSSFMAYFLPTPVPWGVAQSGLLFIAACLTFARRSGPVRRPLIDSRLSPLEFVETLGDLYHRRQAVGIAVDTAYRRFRFLIARMAGTSPSAPNQLIYQAATKRLGRKDPELFKILQQCERVSKDPQINEAEAVRLVQALQDCLAMLRLNGHPRG